MKSALRADLENMGYDVLDLGTNDETSVDYPDQAAALADAIERGDAARGVAICGTGIGMSIALNRHYRTRAALCHDADSARLSREHNDANVLTLGARSTPVETARECLRVFLDTPFEGGRHARRVAKMS